MLLVHTGTDKNSDPPKHECAWREEGVGVMVVCHCMIRGVAQGDGVGLVDLTRIKVLGKNVTLLPPATRKTTQEKEERGKILTFL